MKPNVKWPLEMAVMERLSWRFQSAVLFGLVGLSSKIFLGRFMALQRTLACIGLHVHLVQACPLSSSLILLISSGISSIRLFEMLVLSLSNVW